MRGEPRGPSGGSRRAAGVLLCVLLSAAAAAAPAQTLRGYTQVQFQRFDVVDDRSDRDLWLRTLQLDGTRRFGQNLDVSGQIYWNEVSTRGRPDRIRSPRGTLRLAHPEAGVWLSYRPVRSTDAVGLTTESNELQASGYFARPKLPAINATWTRRTQQSPLFPTPPSVTRNVTAAQTIGPASLRLGWFDQVRDAITKSLPGDKRQNAMAGGEVRFGPRRASFLAQYDVNETKRIVGGTVTERSLLHTASLNGTSRISPKTDAALTYGFRRTLTRNGVRTDLDDHEGNATFNFRPRPSLRFGSGGGVRTLRTVEQDELQWYLLLLASIEGRVRPYWTGRAGVARSLNWTSGDRARPVDTYQANTTMRFARGLDLSANGQVNVTDATGLALADSAGRNSRVVSQGSLLLNLIPLRPFAATVSLQGYRSGPSVGRAAASSRSSGLDLRWTPSAAVDLTGSVQRSRGLRRSDPQMTIWRGTARWSPSRNLQLDGTYLRSDQPRGEAGLDLPAGRETWSARALLGLSSDFRLQAVWSLVDAGLQTRATRLELGATLALRR